MRRLKLRPIPVMPERLARITDPEPSNRRLRFELIFASVWLALGLFLVPAIIYWVGITILGPYGDAPGGGLGTFYADFFGDLATGEARAWFIALGPLILISVARAVFIGVRSPAATDDAARATARKSTPAPVAKAADTAADRRRVEPRISD